MSDPRSQRGFTLVELMLVVGIVGVLAVLAISTINMRTYHYRELAREVYNTVNIARGQAVRGAVKTTVWVDNNRIYAFVDADDSCAFTAGETLFHVFPPLVAPSGFSFSNIERTATLPANMSIIGGGPLLLDSGPNPGPCTSFDSLGMHVDIDDEPRQANIQIIDSQAGYSMTLEIGVSGALQLN